MIWGMIWGMIWLERDDMRDDMGGDMGPYHPSYHPTPARSSPISAHLRGMICTASSFIIILRVVVCCVSAGPILAGPSREKTVEIMYSTTNKI